MLEAICLMGTSILVAMVGLGLARLVDPSAFGDEADGGRAEGYCLFASVTGVTVMCAYCGPMLVHVARMAAEDAMANARTPEAVHAAMPVVFGLRMPDIVYMASVVTFLAALAILGLWMAVHVRPPIEGSRPSV